MENPNMLVISKKWRLQDSDSRIQKSLNFGAHDTEAHFTNVTYSESWKKLNPFFEKIMLFSDSESVAKNGKKKKVNLSS